MRSSSHRLALSALSLLALGAAACGSDEADSPDTSIAAVAAPVSSAAPTTAVTTVDADTVAYCAAEVAVEQGGAELGDPDLDTRLAATALLPLAQKVHDLAPPELTSVFDAAIAAIQTAIETGSPESLQSLNLTAAHEYDVAHCGWTTTAVKTQDYKFVGVPESLSAGTYNFEVTNEGTEPHVMIIVKKKAGVTASFEEILADPAAESMVDTMAAAFNPPGGNSHAVATLEPGEYLALCPIGKGTTMTTEGTGEPHFMLGMQQVITVTA